MTKYRKKPVVIDAIQWDGSGDSFLEIRSSFDSDRTFYLRWGKFTIETLEGEMHVSPNDWVIKGVKGEVYPCKPDIFAMTYEAVE